MTIHVIPLDDIMPHYEGPDCPCEPSWNSKTGLSIHNSHDGREFYEERNETPPGGHKGWKRIEDPG